MSQLRSILLVEDDLVDAMIFIRATGELYPQIRVEYVKNCDDAFRYLGNFAKPSLIFLDINLPKMSGLEFLSILKSSPKRSSIPVVVLTTSPNDCDITEAMEKGAAGYILKKPDYQCFLRTIKIVLDYWTVSLNPEVLFG